MFRNLKNKFLNLFSSPTSSMQIGGDFLPLAKTRDYLDSYEVSHLVRSAIKKIAEKSSTIDFELFKIGAGKVDEIEQHDLLKFLKKPNDQMTGADLLKITVVFQILTGNAYWFKVKSTTGKVLQLYPIRADLMSLKIDEATGEVLRYEYNKVNGTKMILQVEDVVHFKNPNPVSIYEGGSDMTCLMEIVRSSLFSEKWNAKIFKNSAVPDGILTSKGKPSEKDREELEKKFYEKYGGVDNARKVAIFGGGLEFQDITKSHKDMDFQNLRTASRDDVFMTLGVNKAVMGITEDVNRANAETGVYVFMSETIEPIFRAWVERLNLSLVPDFDDSIYLWFKDPTPEDEESLDKHHEVALNKWMTVNEVRDERGLEVVEGGDVLYQQMNSVPIGTGGQQTNQTEKLLCPLVTKNEKRKKRIYKDALKLNRFLRLKEEVYDGVVSSLKGMKKKKEDEKPKYTESQKELVWKAFDVRLQKYEDKWKIMQVVLFKGQERRILKQIKESNFLGKVKSEKLGVVDWEKENEIFAKKAKPVIIEIVSESGEIAMNMVGTFYFDPKDEKTAKWIEKKAITFAQEVNATTKKRLKKSLAEGLLEGEGINKLAKRVREVMGNRIASSSETIARTEVLSASNAGTQYGYEQSGVVKKKEWLATRDGKTRDSHIHADGQIVDLNKSFSVGGSKLKYPGDPSGPVDEIVNCRCTTIDSSSYTN